MAEVSVILSHVLVYRPLTFHTRWAREMIAKDQQKFPARGAELPPMSRDEINESVQMPQSNEAPDEEHGFEEPGLDDIDEDEDLDLEALQGNASDHSQDQDDYNGDVSIDALGDIARTAQA